MNRIQLSALTAFAAVAERRSFTRAAAQLGVALPTVSQTIRALEEELGVRLFNRTTRSVALTEAGERLLGEVQPILEGIDLALESVNAFRDKPAGTLRLAVTRPFATTLLAPLVQPFLAEYPAISLEIVVDDGRTDIVSGRFDAGIRVGYQVERDMTVLRIADAFRMLAVAAPAYLERHPAPRAPEDLQAHDCVQFRLPWDGSLLTWVFARGEQEVEVAVKSPLIVNDVELMVSTVVDGVGVGYLPEPIVAGHLAEGRLVNLLGDWSGGRSGVFLYHPSRRQPPMPLLVFLRFVEAWSARAKG
jgi:DNA-binding transcriptional LysR family regulator